MIRINNKILAITGWVLLASALVTAVGFAEKSQSEVECKGIQVSIDDHSGVQFVTEADIMDLFSSKSASVQGKPMSSIDMRNIEKKVMANPFVKDAEVFASIDGKIKIEVRQRIPVLRVINYSNEHFYVDKDGEFMPLGNDFHARVPVVSGFLFDGLDQRNLGFSARYGMPDSIRPVLVQVYEVASRVGDDGFWNAFIEQIYVNNKNEIELIPRVGNQIILIGSSDDLDGKLSNLMRFYKVGPGRTGWDTYSIINLKFKNQVVCTKSEVKPVITSNP